jgi:hypothetical protein
MLNASSSDHDPGPVTLTAVATATTDAQYSQPPFGKKMKYPTRAWTVTIATVIRAIIAAELRGVAKPMSNPTPASISTVAANKACFLAHFIPILENQEAVPAILLALLIP